MIKIVVDTTAGLPMRFVRDHDLAMLPQVICVGEASFLECFDLDAAGLSQKIKALKLTPKIFGPPPELFADVFARIVPSGDPVLCLCPAAACSSTAQAAQTARAQFGDADIRILDTGVIAAPLKRLVELAVTWVEAGESADTVEQRLRALLPRARLYFVAPGLTYLTKIAPLGRTQASLETLLQFKPLLTLREGRLTLLEKVHTQARVRGRLLDLVTEALPIGIEHLVVMHSGEPAVGQVLADWIAAQVGAPATVEELPPAVITLGGPGMLGLSFFLRQAATP